MDKRDFVERAPRYYALAICLAVRQNGTLSQNDIRRSFVAKNFGDAATLLKREPIWSAAVDWLVERSMVIEMKGAFGPALYRVGPSFEAHWSSFMESEEPFLHFAHAADGTAWLSAALRDLELKYRDLNVSDEDFLADDTEWAPIQINTADPTWQNAIEKLSTAIEEIRKDNGYAAEASEERDYVIDGLKTTVEKLESGTVSAGYLRDAWQRLQIVGRRFAGAALDTVIAGAKQALAEFIKAQGGELLRNLLRLLQ